VTATPTKKEEEKERKERKKDGATDAQRLEKKGAALMRPYREDWTVLRILCLR
jgi:hypothetical protein